MFSALLPLWFSDSVLLIRRDIFDHFFHSPPQLSFRHITVELQKSWPFFHEDVRWHDCTALTSAFTISQRESAVLGVSTEEKRGVFQAYRCLYSSGDILV